VYTQGDGAGVLGGKDGQGLALPFFMVRIRIPNGLLRSHQLRAIADLTRRHARGIADITVRQNIQLHWVTIEALPEVLEELWRVGLPVSQAEPAIAAAPWVNASRLLGTDPAHFLEACHERLVAMRLAP